MDKHDTLERIVNLVAVRLKQDPAQISANHEIANDLGADSIDTLELAMEMEEEFGIEISDEELAKVKTIQDALDLVMKKAKEKN